MTLPWTSYLVYQHKDVLDQDDRMELFERYEVIMKGFIAPQVKLMADVRFSMALFDRTMKSFAPAAREMAIRDQEHRAPCEKPVMMWDKLSHIACETLSTQPTKQEIKLLRKKCLNCFAGTMPYDRDTEGEMWQTVNELDTLLKNWDENTERLLRFYPDGSAKTARFNRYTI